MAITECGRPALNPTKPEDPYRTPLLQPDNMPHNPSWPRYQKHPGHGKNLDDRPYAFLLRPGNICQRPSRPIPGQRPPTFEISLNTNPARNTGQPTNWIFNEKNWNHCLHSTLQDLNFEASTGPILAWLQDVITGRTMRVIVGDQLSQQTKTENGVLSPFPFNVKSMTCHF